MLAVATALSLLLLSAGSAHAWVEQAGYDVPGGAVAACLRDAGPGELALLGELRRADAATDLLGLARSPERAPARRTSTTLGWSAYCTEVAAARRAPTLLAGTVYVGAPRRWRTALRVARPGGRPVRIARPAGTAVGPVAVATAPGGAAALAWTESRRGRGGEYDEFPRVTVALRRPGATRFGRPRQVDGDAADWVAPAIGIDARGRASIAWIGSGGPEDEDGDRPDAVIRLAASRADGSFSKPRDLSGTWSDRVALAVAPNGRALLAAGAYDTQIAYERRPGRRRFERVRLPYPGSPEDIAVAVRDDGAAAIVYDNMPSIFALLRTGADARFRHHAVRRLEDPDGHGTGLMLFGETSRRPVPPADPEGPGVHVRLGRGAAVVVTWTDPVDGALVATAHAAQGTLTAGFRPPAALNGACRSASATTPVELPDGRLGAAWIDNADVALIADDEYRRGGGRLHVARPDPPAPALPAPAPVGLSAQLVTGPSGEGAVRTGENVRLRVRCAGGPCDVRASAVAAYVKEAAIDPRFEFGGGPLPLADAAHVPAGEERTLELATLASYSLVAPGTTGPLPIRLIACAPSGPVAERVAFDPPVTGLPLRPRAQLLDVRAQRQGDGVVVTWRTAEPAVEVSFSPIGYDRERSVAARGREIPGAGGTEFSARLRDPRRRVREVRVVAGDPERGDGAAVATVPVT